MPLNAQTNPFPPLHGPEQSWEKNLTKSMELLNPGVAIASGLKLGIPLSTGQPTTGLLPTLTDGLLTYADEIAGPYGSDIIITAEANKTNVGLYFGLGGAYYAAAPAKPTDVLIGSLSTNADSILHIGQLYRSAAGAWVIRGLIGLQRAVKGADQTFFTWTKPANLDLDNARITAVQGRVLAPVTGGNATGDSLVIKAGSTSLLTISDTELATADFVGVGTSAAAWWRSIANSGSIAFSYNQTDASANLAGGLVEVKITLDLL